MAIHDDVTVLVYPTQTVVYPKVYPHNKVTNVRIYALGPTRVCGDLVGPGVGTGSMGDNISALLDGVLATYGWTEPVESINTLVLGGTGKYIYEAIELPDGLVLDAATGIITGSMLDRRATVYFQVEVLDSDTGKRARTPRIEAEVLWLPNEIHLTSHRYPMYAVESLCQEASILAGVLRGTLLEIHTVDGQILTPTILSGSIKYVYLRESYEDASVVTTPTITFGSLRSAFINEGFGDDILHQQATILSGTIKDAYLRTTYGEVIATAATILTGELYND